MIILPIDWYILVNIQLRRMVILLFKLSPSEVIDKDSVIITTSSALVHKLLTQPPGSGNVINVDTSLSAGTPVSVYYNVKEFPIQTRTKEIKKYTFWLLIN